MSDLAWVPAAARLPLIAAPSPLVRLQRLQAALEREVGGDVPELWCKREDLLPIGMGGNKLRNLEYHLGAALAAGARTVVTAGRRWSNHCRLTAAAGALAGLQVELVLSGPPLDPPGPSERLAAVYGATIHRCRTADRAERDARLANVVEAAEAAGRRPYVIPLGGSGSLGVTGQVMAAIELLDQLRAQALQPAAIVLPTATGGTQAGLLVGLDGLRRSGARVSVVGIAVGAPAIELAPTVDSLARETAAIAAHEIGSEDLATWRPLPAIEVADDWIGQGYGHRSPEAEAAADLLARTEAIVVDPIYTAKGLAGLLAMIRSGRWSREEAVVYWHSGGTLGILEPLVGEEPT